MPERAQAPGPSARSWKSKSEANIDAQRGRKGEWYDQSAMQSDLQDEFNRSRGLLWNRERLRKSSLNAEPALHSSSLFVFRPAEECEGIR